ncbi:hypothetical protein ACGF3G_28270 [Streptomyces sp. NPDC048179]|uniref:hypothetical protein n=1 Tax=Streptomyces sp. NPDC048179 TaxID=3365506 RepID=UPI003714AAE0
MKSSTLSTWQKVLLGIALGADAAVVAAPLAASLGPEAAAACLGNPSACAEFVTEMATGGASGGSLPSGAAGVAAEAEGAAAGEALGGVKIDDGKWDYFFGRVNSNPHNAERSAQNAYQLESIGIRDNAEGRAILTDHFNDALRTGVVDTYVNPKSGLTNLRTESLLYGPRGALLIRANYEVTDSGVRLTTMIPIGGRGYGK